MSIFNIFGRDTQFFDLLESSASEAYKGAVALSKLLTALGNANIETLLADLAQSRRRHKAIVQQTTQAVTHVFVTPIEREDIEALSTSLYRISKTVEKVGERLSICPAGTKLVSVAKEVANIENACAVVVQLVGRLRKGANLSNIKDSFDKLQAMEGDGDKILLEHLRELYNSKEDARLLMYWKDIYDLLEKATDRCRDVGNDVFHIVLKNS